MPLLAAHDPLPVSPRRILVAGTSGSGKTTLASRIAGVTGAPHVEIDALFHGPSWTRRPSFEADVEAFSAQPDWITEWQYRMVRPLLAGRADVLVWLDLSRTTVMRQVVGRTVSRRLTRERLWNGNLEAPLWKILTNRDHIIRWAWNTHHESAERVRLILTERPEFPVVRLASHTEARAWIAGPLADCSLPRASD